MSDKSAHQFVGSSSVRTNLVSQLSTGETPTDELIDALDVSESAVYNALSELDDHGLVREAADGWGLTGHGQLVAQSVSRWRSIEELVDTDPEYWETYRIDTLPPEFQRRLHEITPYETVRGERPKVNRNHEVIRERMETVDSCRLISPIYLPENDPFIPDSPETKMLLTRGVIDGVLAHEDRDIFEVNPDTQIRLAPVDFGLNVGESYMCLVLPNLEDPRKKAPTLVSEADSAIQWGEELFASLWTDAEPMDEYLRELGMTIPE
jgi:predicted transcriptional regulator